MRGELFLLRPVTRVCHTGVAWPVYAVLHEMEFPQRAERAPDVLVKTLEQMYGLRLPVNPVGSTIREGVTNTVLLGRRAALKAGTVTRKELDAQGYSGFVIRADNGTVTIAGRTRHGARL